MGVLHIILHTSVGLHRGFLPRTISGFLPNTIWPLIYTP